MSFLTSLVSVEDGGSVSTSVRMSCMENRRINTEIEKGKLKEKKKRANSSLRSWNAHTRKRYARRKAQSHN